MECIIQYLDDLEDFFYSLALLRERLRRTFRFLSVTMVSIALQGGALMLAIAEPPLALAVASLLCVSLLYRAAVHHSHGPRLSLEAASHP